MGDYRRLRAWHEARDLVVLSHAGVRKLPSCERFGLADQWRRAAYSVALNLAEGMSRRGPREFRRYVDTARASLHEIGTILDLVCDLKYLSEEELRPLRLKHTHCARLVYALLRKLDAACRTAVP